jgi:anti-sigma regulatory factor (Ser/Thr protein kinase)
MLDELSSGSNWIEVGWTMTASFAREVESLPDPRFRHEALFYAGDDQFVEACVTFIRAGLEAHEPTLVVVLADKLEKLREALGPDAERVQFADMHAVGRNPARIIPAWQEFVDEHAEPGVRLRGIGEPIFPARDSHELVECERHEALLNLAFAGADNFWLMCPYDTEALPAEVIAQAKRNHPYVAHGEHRELSADYIGDEAIAEPFAAELPEAPEDAAEMRFCNGELPRVRWFVADHCAAAGLEERCVDVVFAVNEIATNSLEHGGGTGLLRTWRAGERFVAEIREAGRLDDPLADRRAPAVGDHTGRGLWLANQLCDLLQVRSFPGELVVRMYFSP